MSFGSEASKMKLHIFFYYMSLGSEDIEKLKVIAANR